MIVRVNGQLLQTNVMAMPNISSFGNEDTASKGWVAEQVSGVIEAIGDAITQAILELAQRIGEVIINFSLEVATVGSVACFVYCCYRLMFGDNSDKNYTRMYFCAIIYICCCIVKGGLL